MIDFENSELWKLRPVKDGAFEDLLRPMFVDGEEIIQCFQTVRDGVCSRISGFLPSMFRASQEKRRISPSYPIAKSKYFL